MSRFERRSVRPRTVWVVAGLVLAVFIAGLAAAGPLRAGVRWWQRTETPKNTYGVVATPADPNVMVVDDRNLQPIKLDKVVMFQVEKSAVSRIAVNENHPTPAFTAYAGRVVRLLAEPGDDVRAGSRLTQLDTPDLVQAQNGCTNARGAVQKARNQADTSRTGAPPLDRHPSGELDLR